MKRLRELLGSLDWDIEERGDFLRQFYLLTHDWKEQLPNLREVFGTEKIERLLVDTVNYEGPFINNVEKRLIVEFVARTGYRDEAPVVGKDGKPVSLRTTPIHHAARLPGASRFIIETLFEIYDRFDVNYTDEFGSSHFHLACKHMCNKAVKRFLELGQDPNGLCRETGLRPLRIALNHDYIGITAELLLVNGADPHQADDADGLTPLQFLCRSEYAWVSRDAMRIMLTESVIDARDESGNAPLHQALLNTRLSTARLVELLLQCGADPNLANEEEGSTPLHIIVRRAGRYDRDLLGLFFEIWRRDCSARVQLQLDARDKSGRTPLHWALQDGDAGDDEAAKALLKMGADPNLADAEGLSPLLLVCKRSRKEKVDADLARMLFESGDARREPVRVRARDRLGNTALHWAMHYARVTTIELLLTRGADPTSTNAEDATPLHTFCTGRGAVRWKLTPLELFLEKSKENHWALRLDARDKSGDTPLHLATRLTSNSCDLLTEILLKAGADPALADAAGSTPLHNVCRRESPRWFLKDCDENRRQVRIDARDLSGRTPLEYAVARFLPDAVDVLLNRGADLSEFVFPTASHLDEQLEVPNDYKVNVILEKASSALQVVEHLQERGYELSLSEAARIMGFFANKHRLFEDTQDFEDRWRDDEEFAKEANETMVKSADLSLCDLIQLQPKEAAKRLTFTDYWIIAHANRFKRSSMWQACELYLCNQLLRGFFRGWALYPFRKLIHHRLSIEICEMIVDQLENKDLYNICLAVTAQSL